MVFGIIWVMNLLLWLSSSSSKADAHPICLNLADTNICAGVQIQVPTYPKLYNNSEDLEHFLTINFNFSSTLITKAKCSSSLFLDLLGIPVCRQFRCSAMAQDLIARGLDDKRPTHMYSHCFSEPQVYRSCQSVCYNAAKEANNYIDGNCQGAEADKRNIWTEASTCDLYSPFLECNMFATEDLFSHAPGLWDAPILNLSWIAMAVWASLAII